VRAAWVGGFYFGKAHFWFEEPKVFNTGVENAVEKQHRIPVSDSSGYASALCTAAGAGTFGVQLLAKTEHR
jgi:hypothetical protein